MSVLDNLIQAKELGRLLGHKPAQFLVKDGEHFVKAVWPDLRFATRDPDAHPGAISELLGMRVYVRPHVPDGEVWILDHKGETVLARITYARGADADS
jgi:hypothetical protein